MCGYQGVAGYVGTHRAIAQDDMRQNGEYGFTHRTLEAPDGETAQTDPEVMRVAGQAPTSVTGRLVCELKAEGEEEGQHTLEKCFAIIKQVRVGGFIVEIDGNGAVVPHPCGGCAQVSPPGHQVSSADAIR